jgi:hypothetical protein
MRNIYIEKWHKYSASYVPNDIAESLSSKSIQTFENMVKIIQAFAGIFQEIYCIININYTKQIFKRSLME